MGGLVLVVPWQGAGQHCHIAACPGAGSKVLPVRNAAWLRFTPWGREVPHIYTEGGQPRKEIRSTLTLLPFSPCR